MDQGLAYKAIRDILVERGNIQSGDRVHMVFIDCATLHPGQERSRHVGTYGVTSEGIARQTMRLTPLAKQFANIDWLVGHVRVVACHCNAGEHRSVAVGEFCRRAMDMLAPVLHLCRTQWSYRSCDCCNECDPTRDDPARERAVGIWRKLCWGGA
jgi:hypothetical protein